MSTRHTPGPCNSSPPPDQEHRPALPAKSKRHTRRRLRALGVVYLVLGGLFICFVVLAPGVINAAAPPYHVPHACACLECLHGMQTAPDGRVYCPAYPPKDILDANMSPSVRRARLIGGAGCGIVGLFFAISMLISGVLWLLGLWIPQRPRPWYAIMCLAGPLLVVFFFLASGCLKCVYPIPPM
jgi:hypothetical protein